MLLLKVIVALSVYHHYCVGKYIFSVDYAVGFEISDEDLEIIDDDFPADSDESETKDDEFREVSYEILITDGEFTADSHENYIIDEEYTSDSDESQMTDEEYTAESQENYITDDELTTKPDENPTTDSEITTKPDENPTTESGECSKGKSLFSKKDLRTFVGDKFTKLGLNKRLIEHIVPEAKDINQKHSEDFDEFLNWFESKPEHLKDVLQGLAAVRQRTIEPEAQEMARILKDYPQLKEEIDSKLNKSNELNKKVNRCDNICKNNCEEPEPSHIFKRSIPEEYLCISLPDLKIQVTTELNEKFDGFLNKIKGNLRNTNQTFTETIKNIKAELKGGALKEFSLTMYDVLNLQKEYHSFVNEINSTEAKTLMYAVKQRKFEIDSKLLELEKLIEPYRSYCSNCHKGPFKRSVRQTKLNENENPKVSIVHEIIQEKYNEEEKELNEIIEGTFKNLNELINDPKRRETYLNNLKLKEKEIIEVANKERLDLEQLQSVASLESIKKLYDLDSVSKDMLINIDEKITRLKNIIK